MAQPTNEEIIQQLTNSTAPDQPMNGAAVAPPPPTKTSELAMAKARLAFAKSKSQENVATTKALLQAKQVLGVNRPLPPPGFNPVTGTVVETNPEVPLNQNDALSTGEFGNVTFNEPSVPTNIHNNPGNIQKGQGYAGETGETYGNDRPTPFVDFDTPQMGVRAMFVDMRAKMKEFDGNLLEMVNKYAPPSENNTQAYYDHLKNSVDGKEIVTEKDLPTIIKAMISHENGSNTDVTNYYLNNPTIVDEAHQLSSLNLPAGTTYEQAKLEYNQQAQGIIGAHAPADEETEPGQPYVIQAGDTLSEIAQRQGISLEELQRLNPQTVGHETEIQPGQELILEEPIEQVADSGVSQESATPPVEAPVSTNELDTGPIDQGPQNLDASLDSVTANIPTPVAVDEPTPKDESITVFPPETIADDISPDSELAKIATDPLLPHLKEHKPPLKKESVVLNQLEAGVEKVSQEITKLGDTLVKAKDAFVSGVSQSPNLALKGAKNAIESITNQLPDLPSTADTAKVFDQLEAFGNDIINKADELLDTGVAKVKGTATVITKDVLADIKIAKELGNKLVDAKNNFVKGISKSKEILSDKEKWVDAKDALVKGASKAPDEALEGMDKAGDTLAIVSGRKTDPDLLPAPSGVDYEALVVPTEQSAQRNAIMNLDVDPTLKRNILELVEAPSMENKSPIVVHKGSNVVGHEDGTWTAYLNGRIVSNLTEKEATYYATRFQRDSAKQAIGAYEEWSIGDVKNYLIGSIGGLDSYVAGVVVGEQSLQGKVNNYNRLKQSQKLLNKPETDLTPADVKMFRSILTSKTLTTAQEQFKNDPKFGVLSKLQKEADENKEQRKLITEYADKWRDLFPTNDAGFQASQSIYDLIADKDGELAAVWEMLKSHKAAYAKEGLGSAAYSLALVSGGLFTQSATLATFIRDESQRAKAAWIEKHGEENYTPEVQNSIENWMALKVVTQKISLGYLDKVVGKGPPGGHVQWIRKIAKKIGETTPPDIKILGKIGGKVVDIGSGMAGEALQGGGEVVIEGQLPKETVDWRATYKGALMEGLGSLSLAPTFAAANVTTAVTKKILSPSNEQQLKDGLKKKKTAIEEQIKRIEKFEKDTNPKDLARLEELTNEVVEIESAIVELPNVTTDAKSGELKVETKNPKIKKLFEKHKDLANQTNGTVDDVINAIKTDLEENLNTSGSELDTLQSRLPQVVTKENSIRETFAGRSDTATIKVKDTQYGEALNKEIEGYEKDLKTIEADEKSSDIQKIIATEKVQEKINTIGNILEETAKPSLLKAEKEYQKLQLEKVTTQLEGKKENIVNVQINKDAGKDITDAEVTVILDEIIMSDKADNPNYIPIEEHPDYGPGDIVDLKNDENQENQDTQGYVIEEIVGLLKDGKVHVRIKGLTETIPVDQLIPRVRPDETPRTILEKFQALTQRNMSDKAQKLVQAKFDEFIKKYAPKDDGKGGKTFGSIEDSEEEHDKLSIDETKKKLEQSKADPQALPEDTVYWQDQVDRKIEKAKRAEKEEQAEKTMADVHEEILEGDTKKWKGLAKYHEEIINSYKNLTDPVLRDRHIRALTSKMITHATNLSSKLAEFKRAKGMIPNLASGMGAVVVGSIDEKSPRGVRKMNYKTVSMPLTEADAKAQAKANGTEYKEGQSFESRKNNGQFVTLITDKTHKFKNFTINKSDGLINNLEGEVKYGKLIMGTVQGYKKTSMAQAAANQEIKIKAKQNVYDTLVKLRGGMSRVVEEVTDEQREDIKIDEAVDEASTLENQLKEAETELKTTVDAFNELGEDDENKKILRDKIDELKTTIAGLKSRIAESKTDEPAGDDTRTEDQAPEESTKSPDEPAPDVRETTKDEEGKPGEQLEFSFAGKNFIESATLVYQTAIKAVSKDNLDKALGLVGKKFTDLVNIGKRVKEGGIHTLSDADIETPKALTKALINLGLDSKSAKILSNRYTKFAARFRETLYHPIVKGNTVVLLDRDENAEEPVKYGGAQLKVISIKGDKAKVQGPGVEGGNAFTVKLADLQDTTNYAIRQPLSLLYREDTKNPDNQQGILPNQVIFSMMIGAMTWRQRTSDNNVFGDSDYKMEAFLYNNTQKLSSNEKAELQKLGYSYNDVARQIGYDISQMLHLSPAKASGELTQEGIDIYYEHLIPALGMAAIETAQGNDSEAYFIKDVHKWAFEEAHEEGRVYNNNPPGSKADKDGLGYRQLKVNEDKPPSEEGLAAVKDLTTKLNLDIQSNAGPLQNPRDIRTDVPGTFGDVPQEVQRLLKKLHKVEWSKSQPMDIVSDLFEDHSDVLEQVMGIEELYEKDANGEYVYVLDKDGERKVDKNGEPIKKGRWHEYDMESKAASNRDKLASLKRLVEANDRNELEKFYFTYSLQNHHRIMQEGKINPQGSKVDRFLLKSWEPKTYNEKNLWKFELAVAQNFGSDIDKQTYGDSKTYFNDLVNNSNVLAAVHAYQKLTKARNLVESTKLKKANKTKHKNALAAKKAAAKEFADALSIVKSSEDTGGGNMSLLQGIAGLAQYMKVSPSKSAKLGFRKTINKSFESDIVMEIDGISNGFAMNVMQFPMWKNMPEMLAKIATYFGDDTEHDTEAPDTYQTLAEYVQEAMGDGTMEMNKENSIPYNYIVDNNWKDDYNPLSTYRKRKNKYKVYVDSKEKDMLQALIRRDEVYEKRRKSKAIARWYYNRENKKAPEWTRRNAKTNKLMTDAEVAAEDKEFENEINIDRDIDASFIDNMLPGPERTAAFKELNKVRKLHGLPPVKPHKSGPGVTRATSAQEAAYRKLLDDKEKEQDRKQAKANAEFLSDYNRLNGALDVLFPDFKQDDGALRSVVKYPFIIHMYGGGIDRISKDVTKDIISEIYSQIGIMQQTYNDSKPAADETRAFFEEYRLTSVGEDLEAEADRADDYRYKIGAFINALDKLGAFNQDNQGTKKVVTKQEFAEAIRNGTSLNKYLNDNYLHANISTTIAPRFDHGLNAMLEPTKEARDTVVQMGGVLHGTFMVHFKRAYAEKLEEVGRSSLTKHELTKMIKDTKSNLIKLFPQYKGPLSTIDENGNTEGFIDLSKTENVSVLNDKIGVPENVDKMSSKELINFVEENVDDLTENAKTRLIKIINFKKDIPEEIQLDLVSSLQGRNKLADERIEYRTAKQDKNGKYDSNISQTHNTFPQQLRFIEPGVSALIRQIINMDSVLLTQTMNGDSNINVDGKRWVGDLNVLMLHDAFMASPEQLSTISAAYGQLFLHYNRTHSVIEQTYEQVQRVLGITAQMGEDFEKEVEDYIEDEFFDNKNRDEAKITLPDLLDNFERVKDEVLEARRKLEELASENGGLNESLQMFMQKPEGQSQDQVLREAMLAAAEESVNNRERNPVAKKEIAETFTRTYEEHQTSFDFFTEEDKQELKSLLADKGKTYDTRDMGDITRNKVKTLFNDFVELSGNYYNNAEEEANHTDSLNRVLDILSKGFDSTAGIQLTYEQIEGITQGTYSEAKERVTVSASRNAPRIRNGQSPQEVYTHELLHAMTSIAIDQSPLVRQRIERLYSNVQNTLELTYGKGQGYKVFLPPGTGPTRLATAAEIVMAKKQYEHAFHAKEEVRLHEFMAYANTNASLSNFMKSNSIAQRTGLYERMLDMIKNIVDTVREVLGQRVYRPENDLQLSEAIAITEQLVAIQNKHKSKAEQIQSKTYKTLDASDQIIRNFANKAFKRYERAVVKSTEEGKPSFESADPGLKIATGLIALPYIYFGEDNTVTEARNHWMEKMNYSMRGLLKEFGDGVLNEKMIEQLLQSKGNISKQRQLAETFQIDWFNGNKQDGIKSIWKSVDPTKRHAMSVETREALTNVMLRSDISQLITANLDLNSPAGMKKIIGLIGKDKNSIRARKQLQRDILRRLGVTADSAAIQYADELGYWQMTGLTERLADSRSNAYSIALDYLSNPTEERVGLLDAYATISALGHIDTQDAHLIKDLAKNEFKADSQQNGIISIMQAHINFKAKSRKDLFDGDPTQMMKGYIVERMDNLTDIQIGTPEQKEEFEERGYTESVKLSKIATNQTHYIMYINRDKPEVKDVSGIMSTTNTRNQGTTLTEILSLNPAYQVGNTGRPDMFAIRAKLKQFKQHQNKLAKKLGFDDRFKFRPLFDQNNKIVDYRIMMNHEDTKNYIKPDLEFQNVFAHMHSNLVDRKNTIINDKETVHLLVHEQENLYKTYPNQFINILDPASAYHDRYRKLPRPVREYIQEFAVNGEFMVRIDIIDKVFGYKQKDITQHKVFENNKHPLAERVAGLSHYAIKETVGYGKNRVVLAIPKVIFLNMMSNVTQLMMRKIPPSYIFNKLIEGLSEYKRYSKDALEMRKLQYEIDTKKLPDNSAEAQQVKRLKVRIEGNKIHKMNEAGVDSLIIEDLNAAQMDGYWNRMSRLLFKGELKNIGDKIPRSVQTVAHTLFWTKESIPYQYSKQVVQMTDFMGRYVMMEHSQNVLGKSFKEALHEALEAFVLFDESLIAPLEMIDALGATSFLSYWLRNQRAVKRLVTTNPSSVAISAVIQELTGMPTLGNVNSAWMGGDFLPNVFQTDDLFDEANNITLFEVLSDLKNF